MAKIRGEPDPEEAEAAKAAEEAAKAAEEAANADILLASIANF